MHCALIALSMVVAQPFPSGQPGSTLCSRVSVGVFRMNNGFDGIPEENDPELGYRLFYRGEYSSLLVSIGLSNEDFEAIGGRAGLAKIEVVLRGPNGEITLPPPAWTYGESRDFDGVGFETIHEVTSHPPPGMYSFFARIPGCPWKRAAGPFVVKDAVTEREKAFVSLRAISFFGTGPEPVRRKRVPELIKHMDIALKSSLPTWAVWTQARRNYDYIFLEEGLVPGPLPSYCARAKDFTKLYGHRPVGERDVFVACEELERTGKWPLPPKARGSSPRPPKQYANPREEYEDLVLQGDLAFRKNKLEDARRSYERALEIDPDGPEANFGIGYILAIDHSPRSIPLFERGLKRAPDDPRARYVLANELWNSGKKEEALLEYRRVAQVDNPRKGEGFGYRSFKMLQKLGVIQSVEELEGPRKGPERE